MDQIVRTDTVVLLSGGIDSATTAAIARGKGEQVAAISFDYGQRHRIELERARSLAKILDIRNHRVVAVDLAAIGGSALTDNIDLPKDRTLATMGDSIPVTYVPARNAVFLSIALAFAEVLGAKRICFGANAVDYSGYPDCRPEFISAFERMANLATRVGVEGIGIIVEAPLIDMTKAGIIVRATELGLDLSQTISCYDPDPQGRACGHCDSCLLRRRGFEKAGMADPTVYRRSEEG